MQNNFLYSTITNMNSLTVILYLLNLCFFWKADGFPVSPSCSYVSLSRERMSTPTQKIKNIKILLIHQEKLEQLLRKVNHVEELKSWLIIVCGSPSEK